MDFLVIAVIRRNRDDVYYHLCVCVCAATSSKQHSRALRKSGILVHCWVNYWIAEQLLLKNHRSTKGRQQLQVG